MKNNNPQVTIDLVTGESRYLEPGTDTRSPAEQQATKEYFDRKNKGIENQLAKNQKAYWKIQQYSELGDYILLRVKSIPTKDDMTAANLGRLVYLSTYTDYHNRLMLTNKTIMRKSDLPEILNLSKKQVRDFKRQMIEAGFIRENGDQLYISDNFIFRGKQNEKKYNQKMCLFIKAVRDLYKKLNPREHKYFGLLVQLIPHINRRYNVLCQNPEETDIDLVKPLTITDVCEILGYRQDDYNLVLSILTGILFDVDDGKGNIYKQSACSLVHYAGSGGRGYKIFLNPRIMYIGENYNEVTVLCAFFPLAVKSSKKKMAVKDIKALP